MAGLTAEQLDFDSQDPDKEWMWWSIRRQVSHVAWVTLVFVHRRCSELLWPDGDVPEPIEWDDHHIGSMKFDRVLDETEFWDIDELLKMLELGLSWATTVVATVPVETIRATESVHRANDFHSHVIPLLSRGASPEPGDQPKIRYTLEASLWMVYWEVLAHIFTIQRLKRAQGSDVAVELPIEGYLTLPEYRGEVARPAPRWVFER